VIGLTAPVEAELVGVDGVVALGGVLGVHPVQRRELTPNAVVAKIPRII